MMTQKPFVTGSVILLTGLLLSPAWADTGTTNIINGVNTNAGATFIIGDTGPTTR